MSFRPKEEIFPRSSYNLGMTGLGPSLCAFAGGISQSDNLRLSPAAQTQTRFLAALEMTGNGLLAFRTRRRIVQLNRDQLIH